MLHAKVWQIRSFWEERMLRHNETKTKPWWYPRHPGVTLLDCAGIVTTFFWLTQSQHWTTDVYLLTLVALYSVSGIYHHVQYRAWLGKLDHIMIFYVIAITALPYWGHIMPWKWYEGGLGLIVCICLLGTIVKTVSFLPRFVSGATYLLASAPMVSYFVIYFGQIGTPYGWWWMIGLLFYGAQLIVYTVTEPNPYPKQFGFREIQHTLLLCATNIHCWVAISLT